MFCIGKTFLFLALILSSLQGLAQSVPGLTPREHKQAFNPHHVSMAELEDALIVAFEANPEDPKRLPKLREVSVYLQRLIYDLEKEKLSNNSKNASRAQELLNTIYTHKEKARGELLNGTSPTFSRAALIALAKPEDPWKKTELELLFKSCSCR